MNPSEAIIGPLLVVGLLPIGQLVASIIALMYFNLAHPPRENECVARLGRITLLAFLWGLFGCLGTALSFAAMMSR